MAEIQFLKNRKDFLTAAKYGVKGVTAAIVMQKRKRDDDEPPRYGVTASRKIGNAVQRNRAKRRLRSLIRDHLHPDAQSGHDYVLIARYNTGEIPYATLIKNINQANKKTMNDGNKRC